MAKFTGRQAVESITDAISAITNGASEEHCHELAATAVKTLLKSNAMTAIDDSDRAIQIRETLEATQAHIEDRQIEPLQLLAGPEAIEGVIVTNENSAGESDDIPF